MILDIDLGAGWHPSKRVPGLRYLGYWTGFSTPRPERSPNHGQHGTAHVGQAVVPVDPEAE